MEKRTKKSAVPTNPREAAKSIGSGWSQIVSRLWGALNNPIYNTDAFRYIYREMSSDDEAVGAALEYLTGRVTSRIGNYSHKDERIQKLVNRSIENIRGTIVETRKQILRDSFVYGYSVAEYTLKQEGGLWVLSSMPVYDPLSISFKMEKFPDNSIDIGAVMQKIDGGADLCIPAWKCLIKRYGDNGTPYGQSLLRRCYRWWSFKKAIPQLWAVALERYGMPLLLGTASSKGAGDMLLDAMRDINSKAYIVTDKDSDIRSISSSSGNVSAGYIAADEVCDKKIYRSMFLPPLLGGGESGGSYSLGQVQLELFNATASALAEDYIDAELEQLWRRIIEWNFGPQENYGSFNIRDDMSASDKKTLSEMFSNLNNSGFIDPDADRNWVRGFLGLPEAEEGAVFPQWQLEQDIQQNQEESELQEQPAKPKRQNGKPPAQEQTQEEVS